MASPSKGRKRLKIHQIDASQKSIKSFFVESKKAKDKRLPLSPPREKSQPLDFKFVSAKDVYLNVLNTGSTRTNPEKKQTLLAPFNEEKTTNGSRSRGMDRAGQREELARITAVGDDHKQEDDIFEYNSQEELRRIEPELLAEENESGNTFGLFGVSSSEDEGLDSYFDAEMAEYSRRYFDELPDEILENIFCQLPLIDLLVNLSVVCKRWRAIISSQRFLLWKKRYYRYKCNCEDSMKEVQDILVKEHLSQMTMFPANLSRYMAKFRVPHKEDSILIQQLKKHSKYPLIEKFQLQFTEEEQPNCWSTIGLLTLVSSTVYDIQEIVMCLINTSLCLVHVIECLYCMALIYYALMEAHPGTYSSFHYRIYYALYLYENSSNCMYSSLRSALGANKSGQQCILRYRESTDSTWMTHEQVRIMNHNTKHGDVLKIVAFAGTGKTTTLVEYTKLRPSWKFLNVAYNKSVQQQAEKKFPNNVVSRTVHSLAFREVGRKFRAKLASNIHVKNIMENLPEKSAKFLHAKRVADTLGNFISSCDTCITTEHVPYQQSISIDSEEDRRNLEYYNSEVYLKIVVRDSVTIWTKMSDTKNMDVRITHDGYLKVYQLSEPVIVGYDCILIDEAQDCTPAVADILLKQVIAKILVGDPHQQIYGFRGATNAMGLVTATHTYYLTQSFRFGPEIASVASSLLDILKGVRSKTIVGVKRRGGFHGDQSGQLAIICRTNLALFNSAVRACTENSKTRISFAGGIAGYNFDRVLDIYKLYTGTANSNGGIKDKFIKMFKSFSDLKKYAQKAPDPELLGKIKIVETHNIMVETHIRNIRRQYCHDVDQADIVFSTAHKSKGLEFDTVRVGEDFLSEVPLQLLGEVSTDEKNLLYVAVTRAKHRLQLPTMLYYMLVKKTDLFLQCEQISAVEALSSTYCVECKSLCDFSTSYVAVKRDPVVLGTNQKIDGGYLCAMCIVKSAPVLENMVRSGQR